MVINFICVGNAFRSIMAEAYLNSLQLPNVQVISSGSEASLHKQANKPAFPKTLKVLENHNINQFAKDHYADDVTQEAIDKSDIVVFMKEDVFKDISTRFKLPNRVDIWHVSDLGDANKTPSSEEERAEMSEQTFQEIVKKVDELVSKLN